MELRVPLTKKAKEPNKKGKNIRYLLRPLQLIKKVDPNNKHLQAIVLCPTRELAIQVSKEIRKLGKFKSGIKTLPVYGGQPIDRQIKALKSGVQVVIGTPGRVIDHINRKTLKLDDVKMVRDEITEADQNA